MVTTHKVSVDLLQTTGRYAFPVEVMQDDQYSRDIQITITQGDQKPSLSGNTVQIYFSKPDGTGGAYDALPDGTAAYTISSNMITIKLAPQVCTVPGDVKISVALISGNIKLNTFAVDLKVHKKPGLQATSGNYFKIAGSVAEEELHPITDAIRDLEGVALKSVRFTNQTLTDEQKAQARANIGVPAQTEVKPLVVEMVADFNWACNTEVAAFNANGAYVDEVSGTPNNAFFCVSGTSGSDYVTVISGGNAETNAISAITSARPFGAVLKYDDGTYEVCNAWYRDANTISVYPKLK